ncbi:helix-turn-helix transcriptional regulator [Limosilactobacillus ingluviei]|uniref:helix-turn-helix transcriptional regulator n=1 Tax=Limosilactobacillus ingluviei TaxID=148604 RepID=UPI0024BB764A|nr:AraC family transcriptional regulator [Limosilactobacillus ingluviei]MDO4604102.1 AraC family transcriptional regulator [Limosilactobacillus ingluviei]
MTDLTQYLTELHRATKVGFFVADHQGHLTERFKAPAMPDLPSIYLTRLIKHSLASGVYLYLANPKECFTVIVSSAPQATLIIAWMSSTTLEETEFYQEHFPTLSSQRLVALSKTIYFTLCHTWPTVYENNFVGDFSFNREAHENEPRPRHHNSYHLEKCLLAAVKDGDLDRFNQGLDAYLRSGSFGRTAMQELRNQKNIAIIAISLCARASIEGGVPPEIAFSLVDKMCLYVEGMTSITSVGNLIQTIGSLFTTRVQHSRQLTHAGQNYWVNQIERYVRTHFAHGLTLAQLAQALGRDKHYLAHLYRAETGRTIHQYLLLCQINEFKSELLWTDHTITQISTQLGFSSPGAATRVFKRETGLTPRQYRQRYHI